MELSIFSNIRRRLCEKDWYDENCGRGVTVAHDDNDDEEDDILSSIDVFISI